MIIITPSKSLAYNHEPFFPERLLSFFKVCLLQMSSVLMFSWMQLLWQNNGARCHWRCSPKTWTNHILHLFIFWKLLAKHDLYIFFWVILTFDWNKASSIYQQEGLVCWYCLVFPVCVLNTILNHSTSQVLYLLEEMDQNLDRQMRKPATQLPSCQWNTPPFSLLLPDSNDLWEFGLQTSPITNDLLFVICSNVQIGFVCEKDLVSNRQTRMKQQTTNNDHFSAVCHEPLWPLGHQETLWTNRF